jgi:hypothetical protein
VRERYIYIIIYRNTRKCPAHDGAEVSKNEMAIGNQWPIREGFEGLICRSNEVPHI